MRHFLRIGEYSGDELRMLLDTSHELKKLYRGGGRDVCCAGKTMVMIFEKPSSRTRLSFAAGMAQLGGATIYMRHEDIGGLGQREPIADLARVLNGMVDIVVARTFLDESVVKLAEHSTIPVINALTDKAHPCQAMADLLTIEEQFDGLSGRRVAYIGDGNNVAASLAVACKKMGVNFAIATPPGYALGASVVAVIASQDGSGEFMATEDPRAAVADADVIYTDTWTSMGQEEQKQQRIRDFANYQVNMALLDSAGAGAKVMHCLPAYRGLEITDEVIESDRSIVFEQAENRLHFQRALLKVLLST